MKKVIAGSIVRTIEDISPSLFLASTVAKVKDCAGIKEGTTCIGVLTKGFVPSPEGPKFILETMEEVLPAMV